MVDEPDPKTRGTENRPDDFDQAPKLRPARSWRGLGEWIAISLSVTVALYELIVRVVYHGDVPALGSLLLVILAFLAAMFFAFDNYEKRGTADRRTLVALQRLAEEREGFAQKKAAMELEALQMKVSYEREIIQLTTTIKAMEESNKAVLGLSTSLGKAIAEFKSEMLTQIARSGGSDEAQSDHGKK